MWRTSNHIYVKCRLLNLLTAMSLLLSAASLGLLLRSFRTYEGITYHTVDSGGGATEGFVYAARGSVRIGRAAYRSNDWNLAPGVYASRSTGTFRNADGHVFRSLRAFSIENSRVAGETNRVLVVFPIWVLCVPFAALPGTRLACRIRRRQLHGQCPTCGYDLRATPERCPERGVAPSVVR